MRYFEDKNGPEKGARDKKWKISWFYGLDLS